MDHAGERVQAARKAKGLSLEELGRRVDLNKSTLYRIEQGSDCKTETLGRIADELGATTDWLIFGRGDAPAGVDTAVPRGTEREGAA